MDTSQAAPCRTLYVCTTKIKGLKAGSAVYHDINEALANARDGDTVAIAKGLYRVTQLVWAPDITIQSYPEGYVCHRSPYTSR